MTGSKPWGCHRLLAREDVSAVLLRDDLADELLRVLRWQQSLILLTIATFELDHELRVLALVLQQRALGALAEAPAAPLAVALAAVASCKDIDIMVRLNVGMKDLIAANGVAFEVVDEGNGAAAETDQAAILQLAPKQYTHEWGNSSTTHCTARKVATPLHHAPSRHSIQQTIGDEEWRWISNSPTPELFGPGF